MESVNQLKIPVGFVMLSLNPVVMPLPLAIVFACTGSRVFIGCECKSNSMKSASLIPTKIRRGRRDRSCSFLYFVVWKKCICACVFCPEIGVNYSGSSSNNNHCGKPGFIFLFITQTFSLCFSAIRATTSNRRSYTDN